MAPRLENFGSEPRLPSATAGPDGLASFASRTMNATGTMVRYVQRHDLRDAMGDAARLIRRNPERLLMGAAALGFLLGAIRRRIS